MNILGFGPGAQAIILQGISTYSALLSAYFFARPVLRSQTLEAHRDLLGSLRPTNASVGDLIEYASEILTKTAQEDQPYSKSNNRNGVIALIISFILFTGAIFIQVTSDPSFTRTPEKSDVRR
jgi:hypothetical protein